MSMLFGKFSEMEIGKEQEAPVFRHSIEIRDHARLARA